MTRKPKRRREDQHPPPPPPPPQAHQSFIYQQPQKKVSGGATHAKVLAISELQAVFHHPMAEAAVKLGVCSTVLKKICRRYGISRWPYRQIRKIDKTVLELQQSLHSSKNIEADGRQGKKIHAKVDQLSSIRAQIINQPSTDRSDILERALASDDKTLIDAASSVRNSQPKATSMGGGGGGGAFGGGSSKASRAYGGGGGSGAARGHTMHSGYGGHGLHGGLGVTPPLNQRVPTPDWITASSAYAPLDPVTSGAFDAEGLPVSLPWGGEVADFEDPDGDGDEWMEDEAMSALSRREMTHARLGGQPGGHAGDHEQPCPSLPPIDLSNLGAFSRPTIPTMNLTTGGPFDHWEHQLVAILY